MAETEVPKSEDLDVDALLTAEIGGFGCYQLRTLALCAAVTMLAGASTEYLFSTARIPTRCYIPECDESATPEFSPPWLAHAAPDGCHRYGPNITAVPPTLMLTYTCPADWFDTAKTQPCDKYVYDNTNSIVYEFDLGCDEWRRTLIGSISSAGTFISLPLTGIVSDRWGRRVAISLNAFNFGWVGLLKYWANSYWLFVALKLAEVVVGAGGFTCSYVIMTELVHPKHRPIAGATMHSMFAVGTAGVALVAWMVRDWRTLTLCLYAPQLLCLAYFWLMDDTVRWLLSKERYEAAERTLKKIAKTNKKPISDKTIQDIIDAAKAQRKQTNSNMTQKEKQAWLPVLVFRCRPVLVNCLVVPVWWLTMTFVYYGLSVNSVNISGDSYLNFACVALADVVGYGVGLAALRGIGRRPTLLAAFWACAACLATYISLSSFAEVSWAALPLYLGAKACMAAVAMGVYVYTAELFPTSHRHSLMAYASMVGRVGAIVAPITPAIGQTFFKELPFVLFIFMCFLSGALLVFTPETRLSRLPDTLDEAAAIGRKNPT